ncbi:MAG: M48 family metalloprotease, partial [Candidatus Omnitrophota bacterium]
MQEPDKEGLTRKAARYSLIRYTLIVVDTLYALLLIFIFLKSGLSKELARQVLMSLLPPYLNMPVYFFWAFLGYWVLSLPLGFLQSYHLEHAFGLSTQKIADWFKDQLKSAVIGFIIAFVMLSAYFLVLRAFPGLWWLVISAIWIFLSLFLAKIMPVVIIPLFFKYKKMEDQDLRQRIMRLAQKSNIKLLDVYEIDLSKKTLKANAAFVGFGSTKRVILADTLKNKYTYDEI